MELVRSTMNLMLRKMSILQGHVLELLISVTDDYIDTGCGLCTRVVNRGQHMSKRILDMGGKY